MHSIRNKRNCGIWMMKKTFLALIFIILSLTQIRGEAMASLSITNIGTNTATAQITGLSLTYNTTHYIQLGVTMYSFTSGQSSQPSGTVGTVTPPSSGSNTYTPTFSLSSLYPGDSLTLYGWAKTLDGKYWSSGSQYVDMVPSTAYGISVSYFLDTSTSKYNATFFWSANGYYDYSTTSIGAGSKTVYGLSTVYLQLPGNTSYTFSINLVNGSKLGSTVTYSFTTPNPNVAPSTPSAPSLSSRIEGGFDLSYSASGSYVTIRARNASTSATAYSSGQGLYTGSISGLIGGTNYYVSISATNAYGSSGYSSETLMVTAPSTPSIGTISYNQTSVTVPFSQSGTWTDVTASVYTAGGTFVTSNYVTSGSSVTVSGLTAGTSYFVNLRSHNSGIASISVSSSSYFTTTGARPTNWSWTTPFVQGASITVIYLGGGYKAVLLPYTEWNDFTQRINAFRSYKGLSNFSFTLATSGGTFYKSYTQQAIDAITAMNPSVSCPTAAYPITAYVFTRLRDSLNSIT